MSAAATGMFADATGSAALGAARPSIASPSSWRVTPRPVVEVTSGKTHALAFVMRAASAQRRVNPSSLISHTMLGLGGNAIQNQYICILNVYTFDTDTTFGMCEPPAPWHNLAQPKRRCTRYRVGMSVA